MSEDTVDLRDMPQWAMKVVFEHLFTGDAYSKAVANGAIFRYHFDKQKEPKELSSKKRSELLDSCIVESDMIKSRADRLFETYSPKSASWWKQWLSLCEDRDNFESARVILADKSGEIDRAICPVDKEVESFTKAFPSDILFTNEHLKGAISIGAFCWAPKEIIHI